MVTAVLVGMRCIAQSAWQQEEAARAGKPTGSEKEVEAAVKQLQAKGVKQVLVKLGGDGCILYGASDEPLRQGIFPVKKVRLVRLPVSWIHPGFVYAGH